MTYSAYQKILWQQRVLSAVRTQNQAMFSYILIYSMIMIICSSASCAHHISDITLTRDTVLKSTHDDIFTAALEAGNDTKECLFATFLGRMVTGSVLFLFMVFIFLIFQTHKAAAKAIDSNEALKRKHKEELEKTMLCISHNLRTPLFLIDMGFKQLQEDFKNPNSYDPIISAELHANIRSHIMHMEEMISNGMPTKTVLPLENYPCFPLKQETESFLELFQLASINKKMSYHIDVEYVFIKLNKLAVITIISNLVTNAIRYTEEKGKIDITIMVQDQNLQIVVKDTGIGIQEDLQSDIFKFGIQSAAARLMSETGKGHGLAIVAEQLRLHNGDISLESSPGQGSEFRVSLPCITCLPPQR